MDEKGLNINAKTNASIWSIFNANSENLLTSIVGNQFIKPIDEKEEIEFEKLKKKDPNVTTASFLQLPSKGIPGNPTDKKVTGMTEGEMNEFKKESNYVFGGSIFD